MDKYTGKGVYGAIAIGKISVFKKRDADVKRVHVEDTENEKRRFEEAKTASVKQLGEIYQKALKTAISPPRSSSLRHIKRYWRAWRAKR